MDLPGEQWVSAAVTDAPAPLHTIIQVDRRPGAATTIGPRRDDAPRVLLGALLALPKTPERALSRLDLASTVATHCQMLTLTADPSATPARLAELVEQAIIAA